MSETADYMKWRETWIDYALETGNEELFNRMFDGGWAAYLITKRRVVRKMVESIEPLVTELEGNYNETRN